MKKGEEWKIVFRLRYGLFKYIVIPFRLIGALATFIALINNVLREHLDIFIITYMDDILIYSKNKSNHIKHI